MSAICGIFQLSGEPLPPHVLDPTITALLNYGLDGSSTWLSGEVALGHLMTHVTAESCVEVLPFEDSIAQLTITADARLDNREELISLLGINTAAKAETPDSQLILKAYQRWGNECPRYLLGDFAFAIWDQKNGSLFCARDVMGVKPLYYFRNHTHFCFSSDLATLHQTRFVYKKLNLAFVRTYLEYQDFYHSELTFHEDIFRLPPAHRIKISRSGFQSSAYWVPGESREVRYQHEDEYIDHLRELVQSAVECRLRSAFPVGSHLTGGLDSSSVAVLAARKLREEGKTLDVFSWAPPPKPGDYPLVDERAILEDICAKEKIVLHYTTVSLDDLLINRTADITSQRIKTNLFERAVARNAGSLGMRVLLSGWGGDEIPAFNGRGYFAELFIRLHWATMMQELYARARLHEWNMWEGFRNSVILPIIPDAVLSLLRPKSWQSDKRKPLPACLQPDFAAKLSLVRPAQKEKFRERPGVRRNQIHLLRNGHLVDRMESWAATGAASGIEYRYPLVDRRIIEFCLSVPAWLYFHNGWKRYMFRKAADGWLPSDAQWKKSKFDPAWIKVATALNVDASDLLINQMRSRRETIFKAGMVDPDCLVKELQQTLDHPDNDSQLTNAPEPGALWLAFVN
ncbi:MAG: hypothetical protein A2Z16_06075 [Chloroflexi bacterium RBG_16_54_18]|nr:MAG: hypothetical protein A2Z16_06075 [Chloroflexi bacterium RBG_16_54_18]